jgi:hypothetical protein
MLKRTAQSRLHHFVSAVPYSSWDDSDPTKCARRDRVRHTTARNVSSAHVRIALVKRAELFTATAST